MGFIWCSETERLSPVYRKSEKAADCLGTGSVKIKGGVRQTDSGRFEVALSIATIPDSKFGLLIECTRIELARVELFPAFLRRAL